jgi:ribonuclease VapC
VASTPILLREPSFEDLVEAIGQEYAVGIGGPTLVESGMVVAARLGPNGRDLAAAMAREAEVEVIPFVEDHGIVAVDAYLRYGKGRHRAGGAGAGVSGGQPRIDAASLMEDRSEPDQLPAPGAMGQAAIRSRPAGSLP